MRIIARTYCSKTNLAAHLIMLEKVLTVVKRNSEILQRTQNIVQTCSRKSSKRVSDESNLKQDPFIGGDALYEEPDGKPDRVAKDEYMHLHEIGHEENPEIDDV